MILSILSASIGISVTGASDAVDYVRQRILDDIENNPMNSKEEKEEKTKQVRTLAPVKY
jgi:hypothetical protein